MSKAQNYDVTVVELNSFQNDANAIFTDDQQQALIDFLARHPEAGVVIKGTGGVRKLRWGAKGSGKRGGARVIYFFHNFGMPLFLLTAYAKDEKIDLTAKEKHAMQQYVDQLVREYGSK